MPQSTNVAIIGAGPYGLSLAAHLQTAGVDCRIFGRPMDTWRSHMPAGMVLKSDGFASNIFDSSGDYPLSRFCAERSIPYDDERLPVQLQTFVEYGVAFQVRVV
jgi:cation diffusion facilitator CzcD-associated flavoprotein CzcO